MDELESAARQLIRDGVVSGISLGWICGDDSRNCYFGKQGVMEPFDEREIRAGLYYDLASLTKVVGTTTRIIQLMEAGRISTETPVSVLLERFRYPEITVGQLLLHNSGLPAEIRNKGCWTRDTILDELYDTEPVHPPEQCFLYSDVGFILLGLIIEMLDGDTLEESFRNHIFTPLGMNDTGYRLAGDPSLFVPTECTAERGCICGEVHDKKAYLLGACGSAGLFSTLADMMTFADALIRQSQVLFGQAGFLLLDQTDVSGRTYGWSKEYGSHTLYHTGFTGTSLLIDQKAGAGLVILTNRIHPVRENTLFLEKRKELNHLFMGRGCREGLLDERISSVESGEDGSCPTAGRH